ncbi:unnamed protein product [Trichobilharzia szidati]|nr:unnamed protein product [Trichobilharzia szidati]
MAVGPNDDKPSIDVLAQIWKERKTKAYNSWPNHIQSSDSTDLIVESSNSQTNHGSLISSNELLANFGSLQHHDSFVSQNAPEDQPPPADDRMHRLTSKEYVSINREILNMETNVVLARNFDKVIFDGGMSGWDVARRYFHNLCHPNNRSYRFDSGYNGDNNGDTMMTVSSSMSQINPHKINSSKAIYFYIWPVNLSEYCCTLIPI